MPRENIQSLLEQQKHKSTGSKSTFVQENSMGKHPGLFDSQEKKEQFKKALQSQEDRVQKLQQLVYEAPQLELKVRICS